MVFSSLSFLFLFLPAVIFTYFIIPRRFLSLRNGVLLVFSLLFYAYGEPVGIIVMLVSIAGNYLFALLFEPFAKIKKVILVLSVLFNVGIIGYYKYAGFFIENINTLLRQNFSIPDIIMPIGISFFTFQGMSYVFDVYQKQSTAQKNILYIATYISLFPQLVAGPIVRYSDIRNELSSRNHTSSNFARGIKRFICGLGKKMLLANTMGAVASDIFGQNPQNLSAALAWLGAAAFSFQIFFDFSGYSDMAIGLGYIFGFTFPENFNYPYISRSITEFWSRWHISLSTWFRDYVYIPLGGNRKGLYRQIINLLIVWMLTGIWHGAAWNFVVWGLYFALILICEKLFLGKILKKIWRPAAHIYSLFIIIIGWVIFNGTNFNFIIQYIGAMFGFSALAEGLSGHALYLLNQYKTEFILCIICSVPVLKIIPDKIKNNGAAAITENIIIAAVFALSIITVVNSTFNPFIYFRF